MKLEIGNERIDIQGDSSTLILAIPLSAWAGESLAEVAE